MKGLRLYLYEDLNSNYDDPLLALPQYPVVLGMEGHMQYDSEPIETEVLRYSCHSFSPSLYSPISTL